MELETGHYGSPRWSWEILDCAMPMTLDTYSNCAFQCAYCFAFFQRAIGNTADDYMHHKVKAVDVEKIKRMFTGQEESQFTPYIKQRMVLQWGGLSDGFDYYERKFRKSIELLRFFKEIDYPVSISTKGAWFLDDPEYQEVFRDMKNLQVKYSIICLDEARAKKLEMGVIAPRKRFEALKRLHELGVGVVTLRLRPYIIGVTDRDVDEMMMLAKDAGCYSISTEFLCIESRASNTARERYAKIGEVAGYDVWAFYRRNSAKRTGLLRLNYDVKRPYIKRLEELCEQTGVKLFVSDAHHKEASAGGGCCGLPAEGPLSQFNKGQFSHALQLAKASGKVLWSDIDADAQWMKAIPFKSAIGFNTGSTQERAKRFYQSMYDYMRDQWNDIRSANSPARYFGGALVPTGRDEAGDVIYTYNRPFIEEARRFETSGAMVAMLEAQQDRRSDGADMAHVAYPLVVLAGDRDPLITLEFLNSERLNAIVFAPEARGKELADRYPTADLWLYPADCQRTGDREAWARAFLLEQGYEVWWVLDPNVAAWEGPDGQPTPVATVRGVLSALEATAKEGQSIRGPGYTLVWHGAAVEPLETPGEPVETVEDDGEPMEAPADLLADEAMEPTGP